ncbi:MAG TPA: helix-turn-helix domain-containing protein [Spirochaetota bacterium]|nr:helix-turn-helix domain-containing protein [Spirochaetota bacterium]
MKSLACYISALCVFLCALAGCGRYLWLDHEGIARGTVELSGEWKIIDADTPDAMRPEYDDSKAPAIAIPGKWDHILRKNRDMAATVWLRKKFIIDESLRDRQMVLSLGAISVADETYLNGVLVGGTGFIPSRDNPLDYDFTWHYDRNYTVGSSLVRFGRENVIAIRVFSHYINGVKDEPRLYTLRSWTSHNWLRRYLPSINNLTPLIVSIVLSIMLIIVARGNVSRYVFLYSTLFVLGVTAISLILLGIPPISNGLFRYKLFFIIYSLIDLFLVLAIMEFFKLKSRWPVYLILLTLAGLILLIMLSPSTQFFFRYCKIATLVFLMLCATYVFVLFSIAVYLDPVRYWFISPFAVLVFISAFHTYYLVATDQMYRMSFVFVFRLTALALAVFLYFLFDLKKVEKERDSLTSALLNKTRELRSATRQLPSGRKKEDPRDIIHRLIEYIDANFAETYDRVGLAEKFGLNEDYMGQLFKKVTRTNIANYINCKRIEAAQQLLEETDSKVIDIAFHVGFDNLTYFYRHFRNKTGYNPTDYRKMKREKFVELHFKNEADYY